MPFKAILFDADGMIIIAKRFSDQLQEQYGISWEKMKPFFNGPYQACKVGQADLKEELGKVINEWGWTKSVDELVDLWFSCGSTLDERMVALIKDLRSKGTLCYLATNQEAYRMAFLRERLGFSELFDGVFAACEIGHTKNEPAFFEHVSTLLSHQHSDITPTDILFTDDQEENILSAKRQGFQTHLYHDFTLFEEQVRTPSS